MFLRFNRLTQIWFGVAISILVTLSCFAARVQDPRGQDPQDDQTRQIKLSGFTNNRPNGESSGGKKQTDSPSWNAPTYHRVKPRPRLHSRTNSTVKSISTDTTKTVKSGSIEVKEVGVTIWRLRPATESDNGPGFQVLKDGKLVV